MIVRYGLSNQADEQFRRTLLELAESVAGGRVCEIGGGANPALPIELVERLNLEYTIVDVSADELDKAPSQYQKVCADISRPGHNVHGPFDLIFSFWCAEHVANGEAFHRGVYHLLSDGGRALHLFPTLYALPFVLNRLIPERFSEQLLLWLQPHRAPEGDHGKFPARYSWCRGPSRRQVHRFRKLGYQIEEYAAYFGHSGNVAFGAGYLDRVPPLCWIHEQVSRCLMTCPSPMLTTYAYVQLLREGTPSSGRKNQAEHSSLVAASTG
jgi:SAM-dependent methyltransferase